MEPKISIIVPVYNGEKTIKRCIDSILEQTYENIEIIIVNDGSVDNTLSICEKNYKNNKNVFIFNINNGGVSNARNFGIEKSTGEYIIFVDGDDTLDQDMIISLYNNLKSNKDIVICGIKLLDSNLNLVNELNYSNTNKSDVVNLDKKEILQLFKIDLLNSPCNKLFISSIIKNNNLKFNSNLSIGEDLMFVMDYLEYINNIYVLNKSMYNYINSNNQSLSIKINLEMYEIQMSIFKKIYSFLEKNKISIKYKNDITILYYTLVWRSIRNIIRRDKSITLKFKISEFIKIISQKRDIIIDNKKIVLYNISAIKWYLTHKLKK